MVRPIHSREVGCEMRPPNAWNGRFFYQANGGGSIVVADSFSCQ